MNPGATIVSKGNVVVLGSLKGTIHAGAVGNEDAFVAALNMAPVQIRIADVIARSGDGPIQMKGSATGPMIAYAEEGNIYMEPITKEVINDIRINDISSHGIRVPVTGKVGGDNMSEVIVITSGKGGVGKTTTTANGGYRTGEDGSESGFD